MIIALAIVAAWVFVLVVVCTLCAAARLGEREYPRRPAELFERHLWGVAETELTARAPRPIPDESSTPLVHAGNAA